MWSMWHCSYLCVMPCTWLLYRSLKFWITSHLFTPVAYNLGQVTSDKGVQANLWWLLLFWSDYLFKKLKCLMANQKRYTLETKTLIIKKLKLLICRWTRVIQLLLTHGYCLALMVSNCLVAALAIAVL